jgi:TPP-dependent pyruvate/acetoin dehydrogenase alpha subunit
VAAIDGEADRIAAEAARFAEDSPPPPPEDLHRHVYGEDS